VGGSPDSRLTDTFSDCLGHWKVSIRVPVSLFEDRSKEVKFVYICTDTGIDPKICSCKSCTE